MAATLVLPNFTGDILKPASDKVRSLCQSSDRVVGSCNGLICTVTMEKFCRLWNPFIGDSKFLCPLSLNDGYTVAGFGFDECNDDYRVVATCWLREEIKSITRVMVCSLRINTWRRISDFEGGVLIGNSSNFVGGKIYWFVDTCSDPSERTIVSFDVGKEVFGIVEQPNYDVNSTRRLMRLSVLGGSLCVLCVDLQNHGDFWVYKKETDGVKMSWNKVVTIYSHIFEVLPHLKPLYMLPDGMILFGDQDFFMIYNQVERYPRSLHQWSSTEVLPVIHVESLVSPVAIDNGDR